MNSLNLPCALSGLSPAGFRASASNSASNSRSRSASFSVELVVNELEGNPRIPLKDPPKGSPGGWGRCFWCFASRMPSGLDLDLRLSGLTSFQIGHQAVARHPASSLLTCCPAARSAFKALAGTLNLGWHQRRTSRAMGFLLVNLASVVQPVPPASQVYFLKVNVC